MDTLFFIGSVALLHFLALISPGPDFFMAVNNSLKYSRKTGIWTAVGFGLGISVHIFYCVIGLAYLISQSIVIFSIIKLLGATYLIYIGYKSFVSKSEEIHLKKQHKEKDLSIFNAIKSGFLTNVLNPKATLFFLSLFTLMISPETKSYVLWIISLIMVLNTMLWFSLVAIFFTHKKIYSLYSKFQYGINKAFGSILVLIGIKVALTKR